MALLNRVRNILGLTPSREAPCWRPEGLLVLLAPIGIVLSIGLAEIKGQQETFQVDRKVTTSSWEHERMLIEEIREAQRKGDEARAEAFQARRGRGSDFTYREVYRAYFDARGKLVRHGQLAVYDPEGNRLRIENWQHGKLHGRWMDWHPEGHRLAEGAYQNGKRTGRWIQCDPDGEVMREEEYSNDQPVRIVRYSSVRGDPFSGRSGKRYRRYVMLFRDGVRVKDTAYWPDGKKYSESSRTNGLWKTVRWHESGPKSFEGQSEAGRAVGRWTWWSEDGERQREVDFRNGLLVDATGKVWPILDETTAAQRGSRTFHRISDELDNETAMEFIDVPLRDVVEWLKDSHNIPIIFHVPAFRAASIATDAPVTMSLRGVPLRAGLQVMLEPLGLAAVYRHETLVITSKEDRKTWRDPTGVMQLEPKPGSALAKALSEETILECIDTSLPDVMKWLADYHGITIKFDDRLAATAAESRVTMNLRGISFRSGLFHLLELLGLRCTVRDDVLVIQPMAN